MPSTAATTRSTAAYTIGATTAWGEWDTDNDPNADPDTCLNNGNIIPGSTVHEASTRGDFTPVGVTNGAITGEQRHLTAPSRTTVRSSTAPMKYGDTVAGAVSIIGPLKLSVNGKPLV